MEYTKEDYNFIKSWLDKCVKIEKNNNIYYVTSPNILRQLKYNRILNKKEIIVDLTKIYFKNNIILEQNLKIKCFWINYFYIFSGFQLKYTLNTQETKNLINNILCDILILKEYKTKFFFLKNLNKLSDILNLNIIKIKNEIY